MQVLAYHAYPTTYPSDFVFEFDHRANGGSLTYIETLRRTRYGAGSVNPGPGFRDYVSLMYRVVGELMNNNWGLSGGTSAFTSGSSSCFKRFGYSSTPTMIKYDVPTLLQSLNDGYPVILNGYSPSAGHAWVVDGYRYLQSGYKDYYFSATGMFMHRSSLKDYHSVPLLYVNCNFGWDGSCNGFYMSDIFDTDQCLVETKDQYASTSIIANIHP